ISRYTFTFPNDGTVFPFAIVNIILLPSSISIPNSSCNFLDIILVAAPVSIIAPSSRPFILILFFFANFLSLFFFFVFIFLFLFFFVFFIVLICVLLLVVVVSAECSHALFCSAFFTYGLTNPALNLFSNVGSLNN